MEEYAFRHRLVEGVIKSRPNRFIMMVEVKVKVVKCHCPSTGRIGSIRFEDIPCLLSEGLGEGRKTRYTVEAISLDPVGREDKNWIGINQNKVNEYVEFFLKTNQFLRMIRNVEKLQREVKLGKSRIDFLVNGKDFVEVKTPLKDIPCEGHPKYEKNDSGFVHFDRMIKHFRDVSKSINRGSRAIFILCFLYDAERFKVPTPDSKTIRIQDAAREAALKGVEHWQVNLRIDKDGVSLMRYFKLKLF
ncbi:MAG: DNA/RNA nuclease SfsA [Candidatus Altiarchaeota archaeon]